MQVHKIICLLLFLGAGLLLQAQENEYHHCFLPKKSYSIGGGMAYPSEFATTGINIRAYRNLNHNFCFGPEVSYFSKNADENLLDFDFVAHYIFEIKPIEIGFYPVGGINYAIENRGNNHETETAFGAVLGAGLHRNFNKFTLFAEYGHIFSALKEDQFMVGFLYTLK